MYISSVRQLVCLPVRLYTFALSYLSPTIYLSIFMSIYPCMYLFTCIYLHFYTSNCIISIYLFIYRTLILLSIYQIPDYLSIPLPIYLSVDLRARPFYSCYLNSICCSFHPSNRLRQTRAKGMQLFCSCYSSFPHAHIILASQSRAEVSPLLASGVKNRLSPTLCS